MARGIFKAELDKLVRSYNDLMSEWVWLCMYNVQISPYLMSVIGCASCVVKCRMIGFKCHVLQKVDMGGLSTGPNIRGGCASITTYHIAMSHTCIPAIRTGSTGIRWHLLPSNSGIPNCYSMNFCTINYTIHRVFSTIPVTDMVPICCVLCARRGSTCCTKLS